MVAPPLSLPPSDQQDLPASKTALRARMLALRHEAGEAARTAWSAAATRAFLPLLPTADGVLALFWSLPGEIDTMPLRLAAIERGITIALPRLVGRGRPLAFHRWRPDEPLLPGPLGLMQPAPEAPLLRPDLLAVPLLAFDDRGYRLGYGGGYYDRTLAALADDGRPFRAIGYAFALQRVPRVPVGPYDRPLERIVTEAGSFGPADGISEGEQAVAASLCR